MLYAIMGRPLLDLEQEWHRQRAQLRASAQRPPPLVTAGLELFHDPQSQPRPRVQVAGMALIFGLFPPTVADFIELARNRLRLGRDPARQELYSVLGTRIQALWAWLPTLHQDCYAELDHATDEVRLWMIGPGTGEVREVNLEREREALNTAFLAALVMNGSRHWGGEPGLAQLVSRFGTQALLVAAQVAEALDRAPRQPIVALTLARTRWPQLDTLVGAAWEALADSEPPWACVQLGRLALRLGLARPAHQLLSQARRVDAGAAAWHDLARAAEQQDDLTGAESAWAKAAQQSGDDLEAWRQLVLVRLRLAQFFEAGEALRRLRAAGGIDGQLLEAALGYLRRPRLDLLERAQIVGWCAGHLAPALAEKVPLAGLLAEIARSRPAGFAERLDTALVGLRNDLAQAMPAADGSPAEAGAVDAALRVVLLALPFVGGAPTAGQFGHCAAHALLACRIWAEHSLGQGRVPDSPSVRNDLLDLARLALGPVAE